ncbi:MAG TPA: sulfatase [Candidatus Binatia bacterium]|nr:sulfatase [Candidatus Binatia bacterium]
MSGPRNLVLIVSDTFRADHLGAYGSTWVRTPNLDALAARSTVFLDHHAASFPTLPARADFFLGKWTFTYRGWEPMGADEEPLASRLTAAGLRTAGVVDTPFYSASGFGYDRGFTYFADLDTQRLGGPEAPNRPQLIKRGRRTELDHSAPRTFHLAEQYLEQLYEDPFFLLVDTWDPHEPWDPPVWYVKPYFPEYAGEVVPAAYYDWREAGLSERDLEVAHACYAGEIAMVDRWVGRLLERLESLGVADETAIVFTSDHGYYFGEHGYLGKMVIDRASDRFQWLRSPLYTEVTRTPLLIHVPGTSPRRVEALTSAVDLFPTLAELMLGTVPEGTHGTSLLPWVMGAAGPSRDFVVTSPPLANPGDPVRVVDDVMRYVGAFLPATITTPEWTLLYATPEEPMELYDRAADPGQATNLALERPEVAEEFRDRYLRLLRDVGTAASYLAPRTP